MPVYEVILVKKPTPKGVENGEVEEIVFGPKAIVASSPQAAALGALNGKGGNIDIDPNRTDVLVRPFA